MWAFLDHGPDGTGEPLATMLRPGNAGSNTAHDHLVVIREALRQLPFHTGGRVGRKVLVRIDGAGATHQAVNYLHARAMSYSLGFTLPDNAHDLLKLIPDSAWPPARRWEPKRRRLRLFAIAGAVATTARTTTLHLSDHAPWTDLALQALDRFRTLIATPAPSR